MILVPDDKAGGRPELKVLALNSGSSSLKFGLYRVGPSRTDLLISGEAEGIAEAKGRFHARDSQGNSLLSEAMSIPGQQDAVVGVAKLLTDQKTPAPDAIGHRIVHGGPKLRQHCLIDGAVLRQLKAASVFAPLHTPPALSVIRFARGIFLGFHRRHVSIPHSTPKCRSARGASASPRVSSGRSSALWLPRSFLQINHAPACGERRASDHRPSRQWRQRYRSQETENQSIPAWD